MNMRTVRFQVDTYGKAPARYGRNAYKIDPIVRLLVVRAGWTHVGSGRGYDYVTPPDGVSGRKPTIAVSVPTDEEILKIALRMHAGRKTFREVIEGFVVQYLASRETASQVVDVVTFAPGRWGERSGPQEPCYREVAELTFGLGAPWRVEIRWDQGDDNPPTLLHR